MIKPEPGTLLDLSSPLTNQQGSPHPLWEIEAKLLHNCSKLLPLSRGLKVRDPIQRASRARFKDSAPQFQWHRRPRL
jgi:hypothetical protein